MAFNGMETVWQYIYSYKELCVANFNWTVILKVDKCVCKVLRVECGNVEIHRYDYVHQIRTPELLFVNLCNQSNINKQSHYLYWIDYIDLQYSVKINWLHRDRANIIMISDIFTGINNQLKAIQKFLVSNLGGTPYIFQRLYYRLISNQNKRISEVC